MLLHQKIEQLDDFFRKLSGRSPEGVYAYRINFYDANILNFLKKYYEAAFKEGAILKAPMENPTLDNIAYFNEILGDAYTHSPSYIAGSLKRWLPRMREGVRASVANGIYDHLELLRKQGKNAGILKNNYVKFMCRLYYIFYNLVEKLGSENIPKIIFWGNINFSDLAMLDILSRAGADIIFIQPEGDAKYKTIDPDSLYSMDLNMGSEKFPKDFDLEYLAKLYREDKDKQMLYSNNVKIIANTNAWITGDIFKDLKNIKRGEDKGFFYNLFVRISGCEDRNTYVNDLYLLYQDIKKAGRKVEIINNSIPKPNMDEIEKVSRGSYPDKNQLISKLNNNISLKDPMLSNMAKNAFADTMLEANEMLKGDLNKLLNKGIYLICWLRRYVDGLLVNWTWDSANPLLIFFGNVKSDNENLFLKMASKLPVDVLILSPEKIEDKLKDNRLYEVHFEESLAVKEFPTDEGSLTMNTLAYNAQRDLDTIMYSDSGMYRDMQFGKANIINLSTTYEEIAIYWKQENRFRPNFSTLNDVANIPVIFAKVSGVPEGNINNYFKSIKDLITENTLVYKNESIWKEETPGVPGVSSFYKNGVLDKRAVKKSESYKYDYLRTETQDYILDKLGDILKRKAIVGIGENGVEYRIITKILNLPKEILRLIQSFDFTKCPPKLIIINTTENILSLEDTITTAFLHQIGFDILFFIPTGYDNVGKFFNNQIPKEHIVGNYLYDVVIPDFGRIKPEKGNKKSFFSRFFG